MPVPFSAESLTLQLKLVSSQSNVNCNGTFLGSSFRISPLWPAPTEALRVAECAKCVFYHALRARLSVASFNLRISGYSVRIDSQRREVPYSLPIPVFVLQ